MRRSGSLFAIAFCLLLIVPAGPSRASSPMQEPSVGPPITVNEITYTVPANYDTFVQWWRDLEAQYPGYLHGWSPNQEYGLGQVPSSTAHPPYDLWYVRVTNESLGLQKPEVFFMGNPHGDERTGPIGAYWFVDWWLRNARTDTWTTPYDDWLNWLLDHREVYFAVSHNPDGFDRIRRGDASARDLNREADHDGPEPGSGWPAVFTSVQGRTAVRFMNEHQIRAGMDFHGGTRAILYPWGSTRGGVQGVSPVTGVSWSYAPPDFAFFDVFGHRMGDYIGDYGYNYGASNVGTPPGIVGYVAQGTYLSWAYGADTVQNPTEAPYVDVDGAYRGAGALWITPEISFVKNVPANQYGGDDTLGWGIDVRRMLLAMIDIAQPYVRWHPAGVADGARVEVGASFDVAWQVNGSMVVDSTRVQWGSDPDPVNNPTTVLPERLDFAGQWSGGTGWDGAMDGQTSGTVWRETLRAPSTPGTYYVVAQAKVDQRYQSVLRPDVYGTDTYLRIIKERTGAGWSEDIPGADGIEHMESKTWWDSPILRVEVIPDTTAPVITLRSPPNGSVVRSGSTIDWDIQDGTLNYTSIAWDTEISRSFPPPYDVIVQYGFWDGPHRYYVTAEDQGGLRSWGRYEFIVDNTKPAINLVGPPAGSAIAAGALVDLDIADLHLTFASWSIGGPAAPLSPPYDLDTSGWSEGPVSLEVYAEDVAGNWNVTAFDFMVDGTAPLVALLAPPDDAVIRPSVVLDFEITDETAITATVDVGAGPQPLPAPYDFDTAGKPDGPLAVTVTATDAVGHETSASFVFTIDSVGPQGGIRSPSEGAIVRSGVLIDVEVEDPHLASVTYDRGFGPTPLPAPYDISTAGWVEGTHTVTVLAMDAAGNTMTTGITITIDDTAPVLTRLDLGGIVQPGHRLAFSVQEPHPWTVLWDVGGPVNALAAPYEIDTTGWADGDYAVTVRAIDLAGNEGSLSFGVTVDGTPPVVTPNGPVGSVVRPGTLVSFTITDTHFRSATWERVPGLGPVTFEAPFEIFTETWPDGEYDILVAAEDLAGNEANEVFSITVDGTPPAITNLGADEAHVGLPVRVRATVVDPHGPPVVTLHWRLTGGAWQAVAAGTPVDDVYSFNPSEPAAVGTIEFYVTAEDLVGNAGQSSVEEVEILSAPPAPVTQDALPWILAILAIVGIVVVVLFRRRRSSRTEASPSEAREPVGKEREQEQDEDEQDRE